MRTKTRRFLKLTIGVELKTQLVTAVKLRRGPANDNRDFEPVVRKAHAVKPIRIGIGDKGYDDEDNHELPEGRVRGDVDNPGEAPGRPCVEDEREVSKGDEEGVLREDVPPEVEGRDGLLRREEDHGGRGPFGEDERSE